LNGDIRDLAHLVEKHAATRVIICGELGDQGVILESLRLLMGTGVDVHYAPDYSSVPIFIFRANDFAGRPVIDLSGAPWTDGAKTIKWVEDKILSFLILVLISPLLVAVAILIKTTSPGPVLFCQMRHGIHGRPFKIFKFRTMRDDPLPTPKRIPTPLPEPADLESDEFDAFDESDASRVAFRQATKNDPRVTWLGRILRNTSIDELPQFLNVLLGDMSIVGPRPHAVAHNQQYVSSIADLMRRHHVKPGITGLAQISGARGQTPNTQSMRNRVRYDLEYIQTWSLWLDLKIILLTVVKGFINRQP
jgi:exopolysaccharide biosynthesis polyprenyl glycosylphosphotransferase